MAGPSDSKDGKGKRRAPKPPPKPRRSDVDRRSLISRDGAATVSAFFVNTHTHTHTHTRTHARTHARTYARTGILRTHDFPLLGSFFWRVVLTVDTALVQILQ